MLKGSRALMEAIESGQPVPTNAAQAAELAKHTPGPWFAKPQPGQTVGIHAYTHCVMYGDDSIADTLTEADARLIAAAPELLEACKAAERVIRWAAQEASGRVNRETVGGWIHHADKIRAAIAKAGGAA